MLPGEAEGYKVLGEPPGYEPIRTPARKLMATPTPFGGTPLYQIPEEDRGQKFDVPQALEGLPEMKPEDQQYFGKLLKVRGAAAPHSHAPAPTAPHACCMVLPAWCAQPCFSSVS
jgi:hypothetical protein